VALLVVVFLLALLGLPFLKLVAMSTHERLRARDAYALHLSCAALVMMCTYMVLGYDSSLRWKGEADVVWPGSPTTSKPGSTPKCARFAIS
jgi:hypothetical protein